MPTTSVVLPSASYGPGTFQFGGALIPAGLTIIKASIDRTFMLSPTFFISWGLELSLDNGNTWLSWGSAGTVGGALTDESGNPSTESSFTVNVPEPLNTQRRLRGSVSLNEAVVTSLSLTTFP